MIDQIKIMLRSTRLSMLPALDENANLYGLTKKQATRNVQYHCDLHKDQIKVSVIGKWYDLPERVVSPIREIVDSTKDYDKFFVNFCVNYDGHDEIVDACRLIARQVRSEKLDPESISSEIIKENLYTSYFISPDLIIENNHEFSGILLWDSKNSIILFTNKEWHEYTKNDFLNAIEKFQNKNRN